ncbi:ribosomal large subunit pseudouridine synthase C [Gottschalkia acidurici 9a]|uniref:Pseudouridine synthase n=1 Tax=Gottschalkia acidurici (strain ATCC 7906 / DSM 604 / BCRC 14475 / CIP 104303 / KCTC 5404 / NCIMB 10678 / 9a) TaxID=1128398 RepID=K0AW23_GOTA9|nr:RluA family pseudouridine synthase [Gottschalkia acidurici]AFS78083.1 ribosomal large subunit pseudouridine synthase C [Gottschalkia acidurici 9a]
MKEIIIDKNEHNQRVDRFLKKYFSNANMGFIYKMLRKKRIKLNNAKVNPEDIINEGDKIQLYLSDETIDKFIKDEKEIKSDHNLNIVYEDDNIVLINKPKGILSHAVDGNYKEKNIVDQLVSYLYSKGDYNPRLEKTFTPSICNRLDRNTSGIIIGAKNYNTLQCINRAIKSGDVKKYYKCIVKGKIKDSKSLRGFLVKNENNNKVTILQDNKDNSKEIITDIKVLKNSEDYSLLEIDLITGRTHQIRAHLSSINHPIIGDLKYGDSRVNKFFREKYELDNQYLHAYKILFNGLDESLSYLNKKEFICDIDKKLNNIEKSLFL